MNSKLKIEKTYYINYEFQFSKSIKKDRWQARACLLKMCLFLVEAFGVQILKKVRKSYLEREREEEQGKIWDGNEKEELEKVELLKETRDRYKRDEERGERRVEVSLRLVSLG